MDIEGEELHQLRDRFEKLNAFITGNTIFVTLDKHEQDRLSEQAMHMAHYVDVLERRVAAFK